VQPASTAEPDAAALVEGLRAHLAGFKIPRSFAFTRELPRDPNGKIAKRRLREAHWAATERRI
jgi:long-chain acyl-CoA synthetase